MCTLSWEQSQDGYTVFFNRDELNSRLPAIPPTLQFIEGVKVIAPKDGNKGGTWIAVNEWGVLTCLLNRYGCTIRAGSHVNQSRGKLVMKLAHSRTWQSSLAILGDIKLSEYPPFQLFQFVPGAQIKGGQWNGFEWELLQYDLCKRPLTGSSFKNHEVVNQRTQTFHKLVISPQQSDQRLQELETFHLSHDSEAGAYSVNMCRPDAQTVSFSRIDVDHHSVHFRYQKKVERGFQFTDPFVTRLDRRMIER